LNAAGFTGTDTKVTVAATLPPRILLGHADTIRLTSTKVSVGDLHADAVDVTLSDVELFDRTIGKVQGSLNGVRVPTTTGDFITAESVALDGSGVNAGSTLILANSELETLAATQLKAQKLPVTSVKLSAPNTITIRAAGQTKTGHIVAKNGAIQITVAGLTPSTMVLIQSGSGNPFRFTSVAVGATSGTLAGTIDLQSLLGL
jgi:hypothetical protein